MIASRLAPCVFRGIPPSTETKPDIDPRVCPTPMRFALLSVTLASGLAACEGGDPGRSLAGLPEFCQEVLPRVDAYLSQFDQPVGDRYGGTVVVGTIGEMPNGMNALVSSDYDSSQHQNFVHLMTLIDFDENFKPRPYLAESWDFDESERTLTFRLRDDVYWHDGTPTSAYDVQFTFVKVTDPETAFPNAAFWTHYVQGAAGVEVLDSLTVQFSVAPHAEFLDPWRATAIMPGHLLEDVPSAELRQHPFGTRCPVGNGPFVFESHQADASWSFVRNPAFPEGLGGPAFLERYVYRVIPEMTTLLAELLTENIDFYPAISSDQAPQIEEVEALELRSFPFRQYDLVGWNARRPQLSDARVRQAITLGTDRAEIMQAIRGGYGEVANAGVPPFHWAFYDGIRDSLQYNPERAEALLEEAGWVDRDGDGVRESAEGDRLEISIKYNLGNQDREDIAQIMQAQLQPLGIAVTPQVVEWGTLLNQINTPEIRDFDGVVIGWVTEFRLDDHDLFHSEEVDQPFGWSGTQNPELDRLIDTLQLVLEREDAVPLWREYQYRLVQEQPYTFLYHVDRLAGLNRRLRGVELDARGEWISIKDWWIPADLR